MSDVVERMFDRFVELDDCEHTEHPIEAFRRSFDILRPGDVLPSGLVVVPAEPTGAMMQAAWSSGFYYLSSYEQMSRTVWSAMLAAAKENDDASK